MKAIIRFIVLVFMSGFLSACDNSGKLWEKIGGIEIRLTALEQQCKELNANISSIQVVMDALQENDYITGVSVVLEDGREVGYKISFYSHPAVTIFHGKSNTGRAPVIGVKLADDGCYYWTQKSDDGQITWILDEYGNKLKVAGSDGQNVLVIPQLKIENGQWMLSVDGGATWESLGSAQGDSFFAGIKDEEDRLILELWDGSKIELSKKQNFTFVLDKTCISNVYPDIPYEINYIITVAENQSMQIETIGFDGCEAIVQPINAQSGKIVVTPSSETTEGKVMVFATNEKGEVCMQTIHLKMAIVITVNAWAKFADFQGKISAGQSGTPAFEYKRENASNWTRLEAEVNGNSFTAKATGLRARTTYLVRPVFGEEPGEEVPFTTEAAEQIPYSNFDLWYMDGKAPYVGEEGVQTWDSGNKGGAGFGVIPTTEEKSDKIKGSAARLQSKYMVKFASGSLFTGQFVKLKGMNALLDFGIPYTCRPTTLKGYYKYKTSPVTYFGKNDRFKFLDGTNDSCHIYVALCDWTEPFHSDLGEEIFADYSEKNSSIIAYGELKNDRTMNNYEEFTIDIKYRDVTRTPKYIVIVASSSKYGDYFAGGEGSTLWIDEFELGFD